MKKIIGYIVILLLFAGTIAGIYYCVQYYTRDLSYYEQKLEQLEEENSAYKDDIAKYLAKIEEDKNTINSLNEQILQYQEQNTTNQETISALEASKQQLETQVENLTESNNSNLAIIAENETTISNLQAQVEQLQSTVGDNAEQIEQLNNTITSLQNINSQLQQSNEDNLTTISSLNSQIESLNEQISDLIEQSQNNSSIVNSLNAQIAQLQQTIEYYEEFVSQFEAGDKVIATFEFDGSVYSVQILDKNSTLTIEDPTSTDYVQFNYWTVDGEQVDLSSYTITQSTTFVANVTHKYDVKFMVGDQVHDSQIVTENAFATLPENPTKEGYEFDGWSINGIDIVSNITTTQVNSNVTYKAVFTQLHTVTFMSDGQVESTQSVRNGEYATNVDIESTTYKVFNGWKIDSDIINISEYPIYSSVVFIADYTNKYDVKFMVDGQVYDSQIVAENDFATLPENPSKEGYEFVGWSINGTDIILNITTSQVNSNIAYKAIFSRIQLNTLQKVNFNISIDDPDCIWNYKGQTYYSYGNDQYRLNRESGIWEPVSWNGKSEIYGYNLWSDGESMYYSNSVGHWKLNDETFTFESIVWNGLSVFLGGSIVNMYNDVFYIDGYNQSYYKLNKETRTFEEISWSVKLTYSNCIWFNGIDYYYSSSSNDYKYDIEINDWVIASDEIVNHGYGVWTDGYDIFYSFDSLNQFILNSNGDWVNITWNVSDGENNIIPSGANIWSDGENMYFTNSNNTYIFKAV